MKRILTIAASDSGGGAGIQADLKTITVLGGFAMSAVTALTVQNTLSVSDIYPVPADLISRQIDAVLDDIGADAAKTGMLGGAEAVRAVARALDRHGLTRVVVDPVMRSKAGDALLAHDAVDTLKAELLPRALLVTPNLDEAEALTGMEVRSPASMREAARLIHGMGPAHVLIKGGHLEGSCIDLLYDGREFHEFAGPRIDTKNTHGTGCTFSAAIAVGIAGGASPVESVRRAKEFISTAIRFSLPLGKGHGPTNPFAAVERDAHLYRCCAALQGAVKRLRETSIGRLIPEIQSNFGYALPGAVTADDVVAFPGRIIRLGDTITHVAPPAAGASRHIAKIILTMLQYDSRYRSAMNIAWSPALIERCRAAGFSIGEFDRAQEPPEIKRREGSTLEWGTARVLSRMGSIPDVIYDRGDIGKEPVTRVLGTDPMDVAEKICILAQEKIDSCS